MNPTLSVITVTLNAEKDLPALFASLRDQSDRDFEFVVVDGASRDGTVALLESAGDLITRFLSEPDTGFYDALNKAIGLIRTNYYLVVGADDVLHQSAIANYKAAASASYPDMIIAGVKAGSHLLKGYHPQARWRAPSAMFTSHSVGTLIRTSLHERFGLYSLRYRIYADSLFMKRVCIADGTKVVAGNFVAGEFCIEGGLSTTDAVRSLCELWLVQRETGENPLLQYVLFQARLLRHLTHIIKR